MRKVYMSLVAIALLISAVPAIAIAHGDSAHLAIEETSTVEDSSTEDEEKSKPENLSERIKQYKQKNTEVLSTEKSNRVTARCKGSQGVINGYKGNVETAYTKRKEKYTRVIDKINELIPKLQAAEINTAAIEIALLDLETSSAEIISDIEDLSMVLNDLVEIDCESDADGFSSALTEARTLRAGIVDKSNTLKEFIRNDIKSILQNIRSEITGPEEGSDSQSLDNNEQGEEL